MAETHEAIGLAARSPRERSKGRYFLSAHFPAMHAALAHSRPRLQSVPLALPAHTCLPASHRCVAHCSLSTHAAPAAFCTRQMSGTAKSSLPLPFVSSIAASRMPSWLVSSCFGLLTHTGIGWP